MGLLTIIFIVFSYIFGSVASANESCDRFIKELEALSKKEKEFERRRIKVFYDPKLYLGLKDAPLEPNEISKHPKEYLAIKSIPETGGILFEPKKYLSLKKVPRPKPKKPKIKPKPKYTLKIVVKKSRQRMYVYLNRRLIYSFKVSTARRGYWTPTGVYRPYSLQRMHYSRKYNNSPMPWSIFFKGGFAIHGTNAVGRLGRPASHGCVRVHPRNAKRLFRVIQKYGKKNTRIIIKS